MGMYGRCGRSSIDSPRGTRIKPSPKGQMPDSARKRVDLPEPDGPVMSVASPARSVRPSATTMVRPSGRPSRRRSIATSAPVCSTRPIPEPVRPRTSALAHGGVEGGQAVDGRLVGCQRRVAGDEEGQRALDPGEGARGLLELAERDPAEEVGRRRQDVGEDDACLVIGAGEGGQLDLAAQDAQEVVDDDPERSCEARDLGALAAQQRDLLAVLAQPGEREAEIGLDLLLPEIQRDQGPADEVGRARCRAPRRRSPARRGGPESPRPCRG